MAKRDTTDDEVLHKEAELEGGRMPFLSHLSELRDRVRNAAIAFMLAFVLCWVYAKEIFAWLREPLENGRITISRAAQQAEFPARCQLVAAMNPCPCGMLGSTAKPCRCTPEAVQRYQNKLSGPLLDRIDLRVEVLAIPPEELTGAPDGEPSRAVAERVAEARRRQQARQGGSNAELEAGQLNEQVRAEPEATRFLNTAASRLGWSGRSLHRVLRVARTIADLAEADTLGVIHVAEAIQLRRALPGR